MVWEEREAEFEIHWKFLDFGEVSPTTYRFALLDFFRDTHDAFYVSSVKKSFGQQNPSLVDSRSIQFQPNLTSKEVPT